MSSHLCLFNVCICDTKTSHINLYYHHLVHMYVAPVDITWKNNVCTTQKTFTSSTVGKSTCVEIVSTYAHTSQWKSLYKWCHTCHTQKTIVFAKTSTCHTFLATLKHITTCHRSLQSFTCLSCFYTIVLFSDINFLLYHNHSKTIVKWK